MIRYLYAALVVIVEIDEEHGRKRGAFDGNPHDAEIVRRHSEQHREYKQLEQRVKQSHSRQESAIELQPHVPDGVDAGDGAHKRDDRDHEGGKRVGAQQVPRHNLLTCPYSDNGSSTHNKGGNAGRCVDHLHRLAFSREADSAGSHKGDQKKYDEYHLRIIL